MNHDPTADLAAGHRDRLAELDPDELTQLRADMTHHVEHLHTLVAQLERRAAGLQAYLDDLAGRITRLEHAARTVHDPFAEHGLHQPGDPR